MGRKQERRRFDGLAISIPRANTARVNLAMKMQGTPQFEKEKGKQHAEINLLGIAYKPDGSVGARLGIK